MNDNDKDFNYLRALAEVQGSAFGTMGDGSSILILSEKKLTELLNLSKDKGYIYIMIQPPKTPDALN